MCCRYFSKTNNATKTPAQPLKSIENSELLNEDFFDNFAPYCIYLQIYLNVDTAWLCKVQCAEALWISAYPYGANQFSACLVIPGYILPDKYISVLTPLSACFHSLTPPGSWQTQSWYISNSISCWPHLAVLFNLSRI